uniref:hypothetical protein n=1 Tax=Pseudomonas sp. RW407 TaxID=2202894 RepID=UPI0011B60088|nr:hypothetical protein [Pseudomonas sp. RW407]
MYNWEYGVVSFIDILGFSSIVERDARKLDPENLKRIDDGNEVRQTSKDSGIEIILFSDSIVLSANLENQGIIEILRNSIAIQKSLLSRNILTRGGIAFGKHYQDDKTLYSEALIKAYNLETKIAKFPRVIIEHDLLDWLRNDQDTTPEQIKQAASLTLIDKDDQIFLDYLTPELLSHSLEILNSTTKLKYTSGVLEKYQWLDSYHNHKCIPDFPELRCRAYMQGFTKPNT